MPSNLYYFKQQLGRADDVNGLYFYEIQKETPMTNRYKIRQNLISIGDDFWIENEEGKKVYKVDGKVLRIRKTLVFEDAKGKKLAQIQERLLAIKDTMVVEDADGKDLAVDEGYEEAQASL